MTEPTQATMNDSKPVSDSLAHYIWAPSRRDKRIRLTVTSARAMGFDSRVVICMRTPDKPSTLLQAIRNVPSDEIIVCTDAFDVLCADTATGAKAKFAEFGKELVFGSESLCFHHMPGARREFETSARDSLYPYLNSGMFMGFAGSIRRMLKTFASWDMDAMRRDFESDPQNPGRFDDQSLFGQYAITHGGEVALDTNAEIFLNLSAHYDTLGQDLMFDRGHVTNRATGTCPAFLHLTQVQKFYPRYLWLAAQLGIPVTASRIDLDLFAAHLKGDISGGAQAIDSEIYHRVSKSLRFTALKARSSALAAYRTARFNVGKYRRRWLTLPTLL